MAAPKLGICRSGVPIVVGWESLWLWVKRRVKVDCKKCSPRHRQMYWLRLGRPSHKKPPPLAHRSIDRRCTIHINNVSHVRLTPNHQWQQLYTCSQYRSTCTLLCTAYSYNRTGLYTNSLLTCSFQHFDSRNLTLGLTSVISIHRLTLFVQWQKQHPTCKEPCRTTHGNHTNKTQQWKIKPMSLNWKSCERILTKFLGGVGHGPGTNEFNFGDDPDHRPDPGVRSPKSGFTRLSRKYQLTQIKAA